MELTNVESLVKTQNNVFKIHAASIHGITGSERMKRLYKNNKKTL